MEHGLKIVALLPMKANSERVEGKNFRPLLGKPLFRWTLDNLLQVPQISQVVINTDAREILTENNLIDGDRVCIRDRKPEICGDLVSMNLVIEDDVKNVDADLYLMTHTTNPILSSQTIKQAIEIFLIEKEKNHIDSLFSVNKIQTRFYRRDGSAVNHDPKKLIRTQDLEPWYEENSCFYLFTKESFLETNTRIGKKPFLFEMQKLESVDIDNQEDWDLAEAVLKLKVERDS